MFESEYEEWEFWQHIFVCETCREEAKDQIIDEDLEEESLWSEVEEYLKGVHLSWRNLAQNTIRQARVELIPGRLSDEVRDEVDEAEKSVQLHLRICNRCCERWKEMENRLKQINPDVRQAYQNWLEDLRKGGILI